MGAVLQLIHVLLVRDRLQAGLVRGIVDDGWIHRIDRGGVVDWIGSADPRVSEVPGVQRRRPQLRRLLRVGRPRVVLERKRLRRRLPTLPEQRPARLRLLIQPREQAPRVQAHSAPAAGMDPGLHLLRIVKPFGKSRLGRRCGIHVAQQWRGLPRSRSVRRSRGGGIGSRGRTGGLRGRTREHADREERRNQQSSRTEHGSSFDRPAGCRQANNLKAKRYAQAGQCQDDGRRELAVPCVADWSTRIA